MVIKIKFDLSVTHATLLKLLIKMEALDHEKSSESNPQKPYIYRAIRPISHRFFSNASAHAG
jgi:hypothetical protein